MRVVLLGFERNGLHVELSRLRAYLVAIGRFFQACYWTAPEAEMMSGVWELVA
jgi:hypothetical protein